MSEPTNPDRYEPTPRRRSLWLGVLMGGLLAALLLGSVMLSASLARAASGLWTEGHRRWGHHQTHEPGAARERAESTVEWALRWVDATDEQQERARAIVGSAFEDLQTLRADHQAHRDALVEELVQPELDRQALESIRAAELELAEIASARLVGALADLAEVLTPEQRAELLDLAQRFQE